MSTSEDRRSPAAGGAARRPGMDRGTGPERDGRFDEALDRGRGSTVGPVGRAGALLVLSGLPCSGKTTLAEHMAAHLPALAVSVDPIEVAMRRSGLTPGPALAAAAHAAARAVAEQNLRRGGWVVSDSVNDLVAARVPWMELADRVGAAVVVVEVRCSDLTVHRHRVEHRDRGMPADMEPSWANVEYRRARWQPWDREVLVVDTSTSFDPAITAILAAWHARVAV